MEYKLLPPAYKKQIDQQLADKNETARINAQAQMDSMWKNGHGRLLGKKRWAKWMKWGAYIGCGIGFFPCTANLLTGFILFATFEDTLFMWIGYTLLGAVAGLLLGLIADVVAKTKKADLDKALDNENTEYNALVAQNRKEFGNQYAAYERAFAQRVKNRSIDLVGSQHVTDVAECLKEYFVDRIERADRGSHIERVNVSWEFFVFLDRIEFIGKEDEGRLISFEKWRMSNLPDAADQAALARAVGNGLQIAVSMDFAQDPSGTAGLVNMKEKYNETAVAVTLSYTAPNGHYRSISKW